MPSEAQDWRSELSDAERGKISMELQLWLDGESAESLGLVPPTEGAEGAQPEAAKVSAYLTDPVRDDEIEHYEALGLEAYEGVPVPSGAVTKEQLLELAREPAIQRLEAMGVSSFGAPELGTSIGSTVIEPSGQEEE